MGGWGSCVQDVNGVQVATFKCFEVLFGRVLTIVLSLSVLALFVMLIIGGFRFLTSAGDHKATAAAQQTMTYAIIGIALIAVAYLIFMVIKQFTGVDVLNFTIPDATYNP